MIAGMVDLIGYLTLGNLFTAHVTGNIVVMGTTLVRDAPLRLAQVMVIPMFGFAVGGAWLMTRIPVARNLSPRRTLLWIEFLMLNGDSHRYRSDNPLLDNARASSRQASAWRRPHARRMTTTRTRTISTACPNFHRLVVHGSTFPLE